MVHYTEWSETEVASWLDEIGLRELRENLKSVNGKLLAKLDSARLEGTYTISSQEAISKLLRERDKLGTGAQSSPSPSQNLTDVSTFLIGTGEEKIPRSEFRKLRTYIKPKEELSKSIREAANIMNQGPNEKGLLHFIWMYLVEPTLRIEAPTITRAEIYKMRPDLAITEKDIFYHMSLILDSDLAQIFQEYNLAKLYRVVPLVYPKFTLGTKEQEQTPPDFLLPQYQNFFSLQPRIIILSIRLDDVRGSSKLNNLVWSTSFVSGSEKNALHNGSADMALLADGSIFIDLHGPVTKCEKTLQVLVETASMVLVHCTSSFVTTTKDIYQTVYKDTFETLKQKNVPAIFLVRDEDMDFRVGTENKLRSLFSGFDRLSIKCIFHLSEKTKDDKDFIHWLEEFYDIYNSLRDEACLFKMDEDVYARLIKLYGMELKNHEKTNLRMNIEVHVANLTKLQGQKSLSELKATASKCLPHLTSFYVINKDPDSIFDLQMNTKFVRCVNMERTVEGLSNIVELFLKIIEQTPFTLDVYFFFVTQLSRLSSTDLATNDVDLSIENVWRELIIAYCYGNEQVKKKLSQLPKYFATCLEAGLPMEIFDGDNFHIHKQFLVEVGECLQKPGQPENIYKVVSVLGPQSSGKSTLMNIMYGSLFAARDGRCSRGIYCSIVDIDDTPHIVMDTEGLLSPESKTAAKTLSIPYVGPIISDLASTVKGINPWSSSDPGESRKYDQTIFLLTMCVSDAIVINNNGELSRSLKEMIQMALFGLVTLKVDPRSNKLYFVLRNMTTEKKELLRSAYNSFISAIKEMEQRHKLDEGQLVEVSDSNFYNFPTAIIHHKIRQGEKVVEFNSLDSAFFSSCLSMRNNLFCQCKTSTGTTWMKWLDIIDKTHTNIAKYGDFLHISDMQDYTRREAQKKIQESLYQKYEKHISDKYMILMRLGEEVSNGNANLLEVKGIFEKDLNFFFDIMKDELSKEIRDRCQEEKLPAEYEENIKESVSNRLERDISRHKRDFDKHLVKADRRYYKELVKIGTRLEVDKAVNQGRPGCEIIIAQKCADYRSKVEIDVRNDFEARSILLNNWTDDIENHSLWKYGAPESEPGEFPQIWWEDQLLEAFMEDFPSLHAHFIPGKMTVERFHREKSKTFVSSLANVLIYDNISEHEFTREDLYSRWEKLQRYQEHTREEGKVGEVKTQLLKTAAHRLISIPKLIMKSQLEKQLEQRRVEVAKFESECIDYLKEETRKAEEKRKAEDTRRAEEESLINQSCREIAGKYRTKISESAVDRVRDTKLAQIGNTWFIFEEERSWSQFRAAERNKLGFEEESNYRQDPLKFFNDRFELKFKESVELSLKDIQKEYEKEYEDKVERCKEDIEFKQHCDRLINLEKGRVRDRIQSESTPVLAHKLVILEKLSNQKALVYEKVIIELKKLMDTAFEKSKLKLEDGDVDYNRVKGEAKKKALGCTHKCPFCGALCTQSHEHSGKHSADRHQSMHWAGRNYDHMSIDKKVYRRCDSEININQSLWITKNSPEPYFPYVGQGYISWRTEFCLGLVDFKKFIQEKKYDWEFNVSQDQADVEREAMLLPKDAQYESSRTVDFFLTLLVSGLFAWILVQLGVIVLAAETVVGGSVTGAASAVTGAASAVTGAASAVTGAASAVTGSASAVTGSASAVTGVVVGVVSSAASAFVGQQSL